MSVQTPGNTHVSVTTLTPNMVISMHANDNTPELSLVHTDNTYPSVFYKI